MKKNINTALQNTWLSTVYLIVLSLVLLVSQLGFAKDRIQYHIQNFDGSTLKVINEQGLVSQSYQYAPFGQQLQLKKPSNLKNPRAFVGGVQDANDLVYLKQRHYNPVLGRFYQPDPVTFISGGNGQTNRYQYGWNDTYTFKDPNGDIPVALPFFVLGVWILDNFRSDAYQPEINTLPSGIGDNLLLAYSGATLINSAKLASLGLKDYTYYQVAQGTAAPSSLLFLNTARNGFFENAQYSSKVIDQMQKANDLKHAFPSQIDNLAAKAGQISFRVGGDQKTYQWLELPGKLNGQKGVYEYIKDQNGVINHRFFNTKNPGK